MRKYRIEIRWAFIFSISMILWVLGERYFGLHDQRIAEHSFYSSFFAIIAVGIYLLALYDKRKNVHHGFMLWKDGFKSGIILTAGIVVLSPLVQLLITEVVTPEYFRKISQYAVTSGEMTQEEAASYFSPGRYILQSMLWAAVFGIITAAFTALMLRRKVPNPNEVKGTTPYR